MEWKEIATPLILTIPSSKNNALFVQQRSYSQLHGLTRFIQKLWSKRRSRLNVKFGKHRNIKQLCCLSDIDNYHIKKFIHSFKPFITFFSLFFQVQNWFTDCLHSIYQEVRNRKELSKFEEKMKISRIHAGEKPSENCLSKLENRSK